MKKIWNCVSNVFKNVTRKQFALAMRLSTFHDEMLFAKKDTDPKIGAMYALFHPKHVALEKQYNERLSQGGIQKSKTLTLSQLLTMLATTKIDAFEAAIKVVYARDTEEYAALFPRGRKPFNSGKQVNRIAAIETLLTTIGTDAALATAKADITTFWEQLKQAYTTQKASIGTTKGKTDELEIARIDMCVAQFANLGTLISMYPALPKSIEFFFDVNAIRHHKQLIYASHLAPGAQENLFEHTFAPGDTFKVSADQNIKLYMSNSPTIVAGNFVEVFAGVSKTVNVNEFGVDLATHTYLIVINLNSVLPVNYNVELLG